MIVNIAKGPDGSPLRNWGVVPILAVLLPLIDFGLKVGPPRPALAPLLTSLVMLAVFFVIFHFAYQLPPKILSKFLITMIVVFCICALGYLAASLEYVAEDRTGSSRPRRVVLGYRLKEDLDQQIKSEVEAALAEREKERDPLRNASSVNPPADQGKDTRDADRATPFKTEEQIRGERVDQLVARTGDPAAPYTESSQTLVAYGLLLLWGGAFASLAACIGILTVASRLVLRRGALIPKRR